MWSCRDHWQLAEALAGLDGHPNLLLGIYAIILRTYTFTNIVVECNDDYGFPQSTMLLDEGMLGERV